MQARQQEYLDTINPAKITFDDEAAADYGSPALTGNETDSDTDDEKPYIQISLSHSHSVSRNVQIQTQMEEDGHYATASGTAPQGSSSRSQVLDTDFSVALSRRRIMDTVQTGENLVIKKNHKRSATADPFYSALYSEEEVNKRLQAESSLMRTKREAEDEISATVDGPVPPVPKPLLQPVKNRRASLLSKDGAASKEDDQDTTNNVIVVNQSKLTEIFANDKTLKRTGSGSGIKKDKVTGSTVKSAVPKTGAKGIVIDAEEGKPTASSSSGCSSALQSMLQIEDDGIFSTPGLTTSCSSVMYAPRTFFGDVDKTPKTVVVEAVNSGAAHTKSALNTTAKIKYNYSNGKSRSSTKLFVPDYDDLEDVVSPDDTKPGCCVM
jgi:hypothetical protein